MIALIKYYSDNCFSKRLRSRTLTKLSEFKINGITAGSIFRFTYLIGASELKDRFCYAVYFMVKLYQGSVKTIIQQYGWKGLRAYEFCLELKSILPYSYASNYSLKIKQIAHLLNIDCRTLTSRIQKLKQMGLVHFEGQTLRILSNNKIKKTLTNSKKYTEHIRTDIRPAILEQPIHKSTNGQQKVITWNKRRTDAKIGASNSSEHSTDYLNSPVLSQLTTSKLLGYKSAKSGYTALKYLQHHNRVRIENNCLELTKQAYNDYKAKGEKNILIKGKGIYAKYYLCRVNNVIPVKQAIITAEHKVKTTWATNTYFQYF